MNNTTRLTLSGATLSHTRGPVTRRVRLPRHRPAGAATTAPRTRGPGHLITRGRIRERAELCCRSTRFAAHAHARFASPAPARRDELAPFRARSILPCTAVLLRCTAGWVRLRRRQLSPPKKRARSRRVQMLVRRHDVLRLSCVSACPARDSAGGPVQRTRAPRHASALRGLFRDSPDASVVLLQIGLKQVRGLRVCWARTVRIGQQRADGGEDGGD